MWCGSRLTVKPNLYIFQAIHESGSKFDPIQNLSGASGNLALAPQIAASGSYEYVVWTGGFAGTGSSQILFTAIADNGKTFPVQPQMLNYTADFPEELQVAAAGDNVYVAWQAAIGGITDVFLLASTHNGANFPVSPRNLSTNAAGGVAGGARLVASGNSIYVVWQNFTPSGGNFEILFRASGDSGGTFNPPLYAPATNISHNSGHSIAPSLAVAQNNVYVVWLDTTTASGNSDVFFSRSTDNGVTFTAPIPISNSPNSSFDFYYQVVASGSYVYVIWQDETPTTPYTPYAIFAKASANYGADFGSVSSVIPLSANASDYSILPAIAVSGCSVYAVWQEGSPGGTTDIFFAGAINSGGTGANLQGMSLPPLPPLNLSNNNGGSYPSQIAAWCSNVYVVWMDNTPGDSHPFFSASHDNGATFGPTIDLAAITQSTGLGINRLPAMAASDHNVYVAWSEYNNQTNTREIFFRTSTNEGLSFGPAINLSNNNPGDSYEAEVAASAGNVYVAWRQLTENNTNNEIMFTQRGQL
jgi:hypothetical protein